MTDVACFKAITVGTNLIEENLPHRVQAALTTP